MAKKRVRRKNPSKQVQYFTDYDDAQRFARMLRDKGRKVKTSARLKSGARAGEIKVSWTSPYPLQENPRTTLPNPKRYYVAKLPATFNQGVRYVLKERGSSWEGYQLYRTKAEAQAKANRLNEESKSTNPKAALPRDKWINAKIRITHSGKIQARIPGSVARRSNPKSD